MGTPAAGNLSLWGNDTAPWGDSEEVESTSALTYILVPIALVTCVVLALALVVFLVRKNRLDRLRHHLMPFYSFDPTEEDGEDWEAELLEEGLVHGPRAATAGNKNHPHEPPKLAFRTVV